jgi:hypothetical protein
MNAFVEHHARSTQFGYRCFGRNVCQSRNLTMEKSHSWNMRKADLRRVWQSVVKVRPEPIPLAYKTFTP